MKYKSTRNGSIYVSSSNAIIQGLSKDGGLFVPESIPTFQKSELDSSYNYLDLAKIILKKYFTDFSIHQLDDSVMEAYKTFDVDDVVNFFETDELTFLELYHGKTSAFKDVALSLLPHLMTSAKDNLHDENKILILTATSGDTGKAALEGFTDVKDIEIVVLFPNDGVSEIQKKQMTTQIGKNVHVLSIEGNFDDAQKIVKELSVDPDFIAKVEEQGFKISSANSINIGRLVPQIVYYAYSYLKYKCPLNFVVPTGNFGNVLGAYIAREMGIPINKLIVASNENNVLTDFFLNNTYDINRDFYKTNSPSMDILISSNLERLLYFGMFEDTNIVSKLMLDLKQNKTFSINPNKNFKVFWAGYADDNETISSISDVYKDFNYLIDPHTAVAHNVYMKYKNATKDNTKTIIAATASPYKFPLAVCSALGINPDDDIYSLMDKISNETETKVPKNLANTKNLPELHTKIIKTNEAKQTILQELKND